MELVYGGILHIIYLKNMILRHFVTQMMMCESREM